MSRQIALDTIHLKPTPRIAHTEYSLEYHSEYVRRITGGELSDPATALKLYDLWGIDFLWGVNDGLHGDWFSRGRATDMGHAVYAADGSDLRQPAESPFRTVEEVWAFDPIGEYGLPHREEQIRAYEQSIAWSREHRPEQLMTGGYYKTIVSGAIQAFGWEMFLLAAADLPKIERVLDGFFRFTKFHTDAWVQTSAEVIIQHDDFVWTSGPFLRPDFYRSAIIGRYAELWKPLHAAGKKVLFCSDGRFIDLAADIVAAGADGLIFEPDNDFATMVDRFGDTVALVGSAVDCRTMSFGTWEQVKASMDRTLELAPRCRGLIWSVGNHMPANISDEMMGRYIAYLRANWER